MKRFLVGSHVLLRELKVREDNKILSFGVSRKVKRRLRNDLMVAMYYSDLPVNR